MQSQNTSINSAELPQGNPGDLPQHGIKSNLQLAHIWLMHAAHTFDLSNQAYAIGAYLANMTNPREHGGEFRAWPKQATIAEQTGMAERTARRALAELRNKGIIEARTPATARPTNKVYVFLNSAISALEPKARAKNQVPNIKDAKRGQGGQIGRSGRPNRPVSIERNEEVSMKMEARGKRELPAKSTEQGAGFDEADYFRRHHRMSEAERTAAYQKLKQQVPILEAKLYKTDKLKRRMWLIEKASDARSAYPSRSTLALVRKHVDSHRANHST